MDFVVYIFGALFVVGGGIAIYERRTKRTLLEHDLNQLGAQSEADREAVRAQDTARARIAFDWFQ
ncbi:MAG: hypothetical protein AAF386_00610 [Pseudomonadota bacterium]